MTATHHDQIDIWKKMINYEEKLSPASSIHHQDHHQNDDDQPQQQQQQQKQEENCCISSTTISFNTVVIDTDDHHLDELKSKSNSKSNSNSYSSGKECEDPKGILLLQCPHCSKSFPMYERPMIKTTITTTSPILSSSSSSTTTTSSSSSPPSTSSSLSSSTTEKRRLNRFCGFFAVFLSLFLLLSSLLEADIDNDTLISGAHYWTSQPFKIKRLPQCIIIGARKCGTRALIDMLNLHPQVEKAAMEVHFFDRDDNYAKGLEWYRQHLPECTEDQLSIEKSPSYFVTPEVPERIHAMNSSIKLLLIVREPVTRVISDYTQIYGTNSKLHNGSKSPRLEELVTGSDGSVNVHYKAIRISLYSRYLQRWLDVFPPAQIHVIDGDALIRDPYPQLRDVERFLGLEPRLQRDNFYFNSTKGFYCWRKLEGESRNETGLHCLNDSKGRRHPPVDRHIVSKLRRFYNPHNLRFYDMVGRDFGWPEK